MKVLSSITLAFALGTAAAAGANAPAGHDARWEAAREAIWAKELAIYEGRGRGDLSLYLGNTATNYVAWPPFNEVPKGNDGLRATGAQLAGKTKEHLEMTFLDLALNGDTAVVYYKTHRTMRADGTPSDERFEVTHTWVMQDGTWKVLGGMARARPDR
ncbi:MULTISPECIES: nuclear transport factor 2 family protein [unclassified Novosphingobium]|uniref:nuclear transport factor 2 family protein n=1 Tax=unclassified Novosphingobium TaxID=2644732 RepID=UPI00135B9F30|nr:MULTISPECIES: nuclear transport factor 2 family protein [unclassified Novosphingobium]